MRIRLVWVLFSLGVIVAACGGGSRSGLVPTVGNPGGGGNTAPTSGKTTHANITLYVPPTNKQASSRKPFYISSNTQAFGVVVIPYPSTIPSPLPTTNIQIFPVVTPSPCAIASGGGESCNFTVTAPIGTDLFIVAAFATSAPNGNTTPLSAVVSGPVTVSVSPPPGTLPLSFTLNGVVYSVAVAVASPDPGNTPNTQVFTVGVPTSAPVSISAYDVSGNLVMSDPTLPYFASIVIDASPASDGLTLSLSSSSTCGSSASGATATIDCAGDLNDVKVSYDGTPRPDASDHLIDAFAITGAQPSPMSSPANVVLAGNIISTMLSTGSYVGSPGFMQRASNGQFQYLVYLESPVNGWVTGTFTPSTGTVGAQTTVSGLSEPSNFAVLPDGSYWVVDGNSVNCYASLTATSPTITGVSLTESYDGGPLAGVSLASDGSGHLWYTGWDDAYEGGGPPAPPGFAGYFTSSECSAPSSTTAQFELTNGYGDGNQFEASAFLYLGTNSNNAAAVVSASFYLLGDPNNQSVWVMNTNTAAGSVAGGQTLNSASYGSAVALDDAQNAFASFTGGSSPDDIERMPSGAATLNELLSLPPTTSGSYPSPAPSGLYVFAPSAGAADRAMYMDQNYAALTLVESVAATPLPIVVSLPNSIYPIDAAYSAKGGEYVLDMDATYNFNIVRILPTTTWWVPNVTLNSGCSSASLLTILERGDSGPFTVSIPAASGVTATQLPGADHDFWLSASGTVSFTATVTDAHGRQEQFNVTSTPSDITCGAAHRRLTKHHI